MEIHLMGPDELTVRIRPVHDLLEGLPEDKCGVPTGSLAKAFPRRAGLLDAPVPVPARCTSAFSGFHSR